MADGAEQTGCACGAGPGQIDEEGFCESCGKRLRRPSTDHLEEALGPRLSAVSDRGLRHRKNEDRFALVARQGYALLVVCDGVSSTFQAERASEAVAVSVAEFVSRVAPATAFDERSLLSEAIVDAARQLRPASGDVQDVSMRVHDASTTVVAALVKGRTLAVAWMGDSRAYWQDDAGVRQLTVDDSYASWMEAALAVGETTREEAQESPKAHAITRWLGSDADPDWTPSWIEEELPGPGWLLLCTDGFWNYAEDPDRLHELLRDACGPEADALDGARRLVWFAKEKGGHDNITVALLRVQ